MISSQGPTLTILNGQTDSSTSLEGLVIDGMSAIKFYGPATLPETINIVSSPDGTDWNIEQSSGSDIEVKAGKVTTVRVIGAKKYRLKATAAVAADRVVKTRIIPKS